MGLDFKEIAKYVDGDHLASVFKFYDKNKDLINLVLGAILNNAHKEPAKPPVFPQGAPIEPVDPTNGRQVYFALKAKPRFLEGPRNGGSRGEIYDLAHFNRVLSVNGPDAQMAEERMHMDISPYDRAGAEIETGDPRHPVVVGDVPLRYEWTYDGKVQTNSKDEDDRFNLESVMDDHGCTPTLRLDSPSGGRHKVTFKAWILPEFNGGVKVESNVCEWYAD